jgi:hypothetical protein
MRFMLSVMGDADYEAGKPASPAAYEAMDKFMAEQIAAGVLKGAGGLAPSSAGMKIRARDGHITCIDGPFTEAKEIVGGYCFIEAPSKAEAVRLVTEFMEAHFQAGIMNADVELREVIGGPDVD